MGWCRLQCVVAMWCQGSQKGKFLRVALKMQQAHTNRLLHMLSESENEWMVQNKEVELDKAFCELAAREECANLYNRGKKLTYFLFLLLSPWYNIHLTCPLYHFIALTVRVRVRVSSMTIAAQYLVFPP
ncbi:hypothetical protein EON65_48810 [archaeon]|nr:MAG: hypothetical protein EON65_48810 [archaeon]